MLWVIVHHRLFASKLEDKFRPHFDVRSLQPVDCYTQPFHKTDILLAEAPELCWASGKLVKYLARHGNPRILAMGYRTSQSHLRSLWELGVCAFVDDTTNWEELLALVKRVEAGERIRPKELIGMPTASEETPKRVLTDVEAEVVYWICKDFTSKQISELTNKSVRTVDNIRYKLYKRLDVKGTAGIVKWAFDNELAHPTLGSVFYTSVLRGAS